MCHADSEKWEKKKKTKEKNYEIKKELELLDKRKIARILEVDTGKRAKIN